MKSVGIDVIVKILGRHEGSAQDPGDSDQYVARAICRDLRKAAGLEGALIQWDGAGYRAITSPKAIARQKRRAS